MLKLNDGRSELWQWDTGRKLTVDADCSQVHFSDKVFGRSIDVDVVDGVAIIPDILLQTDKELTAWAFFGTAENGYTKISKTFKVNRRNKPSDYVFTPLDQTTLEKILNRLEKVENRPIGCEITAESIENALGYTPANKAVLYDQKQNLTDEQKAQGRANIGALGFKGIYVIQNPEIKNGYYDCQPNGATFYENPNYKSVRVSCVEGEKYRISTFHWLESTWPAVWLYAQDNTLIKTVDGTAIDINGGRQYEDCEFTIPANCAFFIVNCVNSEYVKFAIEKFEYKEAATLEYVNSQLIIRETGFRELRLDIQNGYYDCQQNGEVFISHGNYKSAKVACVVGEKYQVSTYIYAASNFPVAWLYSIVGTLIGTVGGLTGAGSDFGEQIDDFEFTIPENCAYFITTTYALDYARFRVKRYMPGVKPLFGKNAIYLGDSITYIDNGWRTEFNAITGVNEVLCTAVSGAHLCDYEDTVLDGVNFEGSKNTISNQVQRIINNPPTEPVDLIIISAGTNDHASLAEFEGGVTQFVDENSVYIDVDTIDRTRYDGAMRWIAEKLWDLFPEAVIFFATPIQGAEAIRGTWVQIMKSDYIQEIAGYLGTPTIDATKKSGIYGRYENANASGKYLYDGLHPNPAGRIKLGRYYASEVINYFSYLKD